MKSFKKLTAALLISMIFASGCAVQPPIQIISKECLWAQTFEWTTAEADALLDCCPQLARKLLEHNTLKEELCR